MITYERTAHGTLRVHTTVAVGIVDHDLVLELGPWPRDAPDPAGPLGLVSAPVLALPEPGWTDLAIAGAIRAGGRPACLRLPADAPRLGIQLLVAVSEGAEVVLVEGGDGTALRLARALGGRPLAVPPLERPDVSGYLAGCDLDVHVPVPAVEGPLRARILAVLGPHHLETLHHLVDVDPYPAFAEAGVDAVDPPLDALAAGAAGVLAGRLAAGNRRWRAQAGV